MQLTVFINAQIETALTSGDFKLEQAVTIDIERKTFIQCRRLPVKSRHDLIREPRATWVKGGSRREGRDNFHLKLCGTIGLSTNLS